MRRWWVIVTMLAGCGRLAFDPLASAEDSPPTDSGGCTDEISLRACFPFDDSTLDSSSVGNHAMGAVTFEGGKIDHAARFGAGVDVRIPDSPMLAIANALTVMAWVKLDALPTGRAMVIDHNFGWGMAVTSTGSLSAAVSIGGGRVLTSTAPVPTGTWAHVAMTFDGETVRAYIDGAERGTLAAPGMLSFADPMGTRIGGNIADSGSSAEDPFLGLIDVLAIWDTALPASRITAAAQE